MEGTIHPQYTFDTTGNTVGVFLPIEEWNILAKELHLDLPDWQKNLIDTRRRLYKNNPSDTIDRNIIAEQFDKEDEQAIQS
jgi:hypothetical protein